MSKVPAVIPHSRARPAAGEAKDHDFGLQEFGTGVTADRRSRRTASPVRVSLSGTLGGDIDGAWWPRTGSMVRELPDLVEALYPALGDVVDINLNWSAGSVAPVLSTMAPATVARIGWTAPRHRLMSLAGSDATARILVVPAVTSPVLAVMVLRQAAARHVPEVDFGTPAYDAAERVIRAARADSVSWAAEQTGRTAAGSSATPEIV